MRYVDLTKSSVLVGGD